MRCVLIKWQAERQFLAVEEKISRLSLCFEKETTASTDAGSQSIPTTSATKPTLQYGTLDEQKNIIRHPWLAERKEKPAICRLV